MLAFREMAQRPPKHKSGYGKDKIEDHYPKICGFFFHETTSSQFAGAMTTAVP